MSGFQTIADQVRLHAAARPDHPALRQDGEALSYAQLDALMDRVAVALQRDGVQPGEAIALCGLSTPRQAAVFLGALRAGVVAAPLAASVTRANFASMVTDAQARALFFDHSATALVQGLDRMRLVALDDSADAEPFEDWLGPPGVAPAPVAIEPSAPFNIIYSSGTTGTPKGIVQSHGMRAMHVARGARYGYGPEGVTLLATPLYSNTTLVVFFPTIGFGGCVVLMSKFDAAAYLALAQRHRATHTMLVPVQYQRLMALPRLRRATTCRRSGSSSAPAHRSPPRSRPRWSRAGRAAWSSSTA